MSQGLRSAQTTLKYCLENVRPLFANAQSAIE
jgi:hypothetical protein